MMKCDVVWEIVKKVFAQNAPCIIFLMLLYPLFISLNYFNELVVMKFYIDFWSQEIRLFCKKKLGTFNIEFL